MSLSRPHWRGKHVVLEDRTQFDQKRVSVESLIEAFASKKVDLPRPLAERFVAVNQVPTSVPVGAIRTTWGVTAIRPDELDRYFGPKSGDLDEAWVSFYKDHPASRGLFHVSRVAFWKDFALVYVGWFCGGTCGEGAVFLLRSDHGTWVVQTTVTSWVS